MSKSKYASMSAPTSTFFPVKSTALGDPEKFSYWAYFLGFRFCVCTLFDSASCATPQVQQCRRMLGSSPAAKFIDPWLGDKVRIYQFGYWTVATLVLAIRRSNQSARYHPQVGHVYLWAYCWSTNLTERENEKGITRRGLLLKSCWQKRRPTENLVLPDKTSTTTYICPTIKQSLFC